MGLGIETVMLASARLPGLLLAAGGLGLFGCGGSTQAASQDFSGGAQPAAKHVASPSTAAGSLAAAKLLERKLEEKR